MLNQVAQSLGDRKVRQFALWGAAGCVAGALLGEALLAATRVPQGAQAVCLLIDCSGSMHGEKLHEVKAAAADFVSRHDTSADRISVVGFNNQVNNACPLTNDASRLKKAIKQLYDGGSTAMDIGLEAAADDLKELPPEWRVGSIGRSILLFTDGLPDDHKLALSAASACRSSGLRIVAIGTGDADTDFLAEVTGDHKQVFHVGSGDFAEGFRQAETAIYGGSLVEASHREGALRSLIRTSAWGMLAACGMALALVAGQNRYLHRGTFPRNEAIVAALGGAAAGLCGAFIGQLLYSLAGASARLPVIGMLAPVTMPISRIIGWMVMGTLAGWGLAWFVPNLNASRAALGGAIGGAVGGLAFLTAALIGDVLGALLGAAILGAAIGVMLALVEAAFRQAWLEVHYGDKEVITVSLGATPVKIGSDNRACQVYARGARPLACRYSLVDGQITFVDFASEKSTPVQPGDEREVGGVRIIVRGSDRADGKIGERSPGALPTIVPPPAPKTTRPSAAPPPDAIAPDAKAPARTLSAPPPPPRKAAPAPASPAATPAPPANPSSETRVIRPLAPPPPPHKKE